MSNLNKYTTLENYLENMPDFVFLYVHDYYDGESINTQIGYCIDLRIFLKFLQERKFRDVKNIEDFSISHINHVTVDDLIGFKAYLREYQIETIGESGKPIKRTLKNSAYGINRKLSTVRGLFTYLYKTDKIPQNITDKVDFAATSQKIKKPLIAQETIKLIDVIYNGENYFTGRTLTEYLKKKQRDIAIFTTYLGTGIRVSELINLDIHDICFETSSFIVTRKGGDEQEIFMPAQVENEIFLYIQERLKIDAVDKSALFLSRQGKRITVSSVEHMLKTYCHAVGITHPDKTRPHALRRTFACRMLEDGIDIKMVAELMGHKNIEVTHKYYAQYSSKARKEIMNKFDIVPKE